ncbi:hypothetical protein CO653_13015 [Rhizobium anhuiense]|uniref:hypothetical protein n=1 Tax=Rhizobium anhuiense TaxID=1184720 RepID=UPI000BE7BC52|nr:hypothetical protein [Rhizobium anhuiense]PDS65112.1 hypothetical protein CO653_13015 [Rhizobium anhuiense]
MKSFFATLPFPPSLNNLFLNVKRGGRVKTAKYRAWEKQADAAMPSGIVKLQGEVLAVRGEGDQLARQVKAQPNRSGGGGLQPINTQSGSIAF